MDHGDWTTSAHGTAALEMSAARLLPEGAGQPAADSASRRTLAGEAGAFEQIVRRHEHRVYNLARWLLSRPEDAEDAAQEAFLRLYRALGRLDPKRPIEPYLHRITVNVCRDLARRRRLRVAVSLEDLRPAEVPLDAGPDPCAAARLAEERRIAASALRTLPDKQRAALVLRDLQGLSTREVAEVLGSNEVTVRTQICRARLKLKALRDRLLGAQKEERS